MTQLTAPRAPTRTTGAHPWRWSGGLAPDCPPAGFFEHAGLSTTALIPPAARIGPTAAVVV